MVQGDAKGSLTKQWWSYADLERESGRPYSTLKKYVHWGLLRFKREYLKFGATIQFHPKKAMERLNYLGANPDVLRQAKKDMATRVQRRRRPKEDEKLTERERA